MAAKEEAVLGRATEIIEKMTEVTTPTIDKWGSGRFPKGFNSEDRVNLVYIISEIFERSARYITPPSSAAYLRSRAQAAHAPCASRWTVTLFQKASCRARSLSASWTYTPARLWEGNMSY